MGRQRANLGAGARAAAGTGGGVVVTLALAREAWTAAHHVLEPALAAQAPRPDEAVLAGVLVAATVAAALLTTGLGALVLALTVPRLRAAGRVAAALTPRAVRRAVLVGVVAGSGWLPTAAHAQGTDLLWPVGTESAVTDVVPTGNDGTSPGVPAVESHSPDRPPRAVGLAAGTTAPTRLVATGVDASDDEPSVTDGGAARPPAPEPSADQPDVVVRAGDSLWTIAASHLTSPSAAQLAAEWPRWFEHNRDVIGDDPDLIHPGLVLRHPGDHS